MNELVLVTGGSGFVGQFAIGELLRKGYRVRATLRSKSKEAEVRTTLKNVGVVENSPLEFVEADLLEDKGWNEAAAGATYVLHIASPFPGGPAKFEDLLVPARDGTIRVLRAARLTGVRRVVVTSSFAAVGYGGAALNRPYTESDWTDGNNPALSAYIRSKTLAERAAWDWQKTNAGAMELTVVNPVGIFGPALGSDYSASLGLINGLLAGKIPTSTKQEFGIVDVRDLVSLQILLMTHSEAANRRFLAVGAETWTLKKVGRLLKEHLGSEGSQTVPRELPNWLARLLARFNPKVGIHVTELGRPKRISNASAKALGWDPRPGQETLMDTARSLLRLRH